jgi:integrase
MGGDLERTNVPGVYRRGSRYVVAYRDPSGTQRRRTAKTLAEARALKAELTTDVHRGEYREQSRLTLAEYAAEWLRTYTGRTSRGIRQTTLDEYAADLRGHILPVLGRRLLSDIEPRDVKILAADLAAGGRRPATVRAIMSPVKALFATALEDGLIRINPCAGMRLPGGTTPDRHARALTEDELAALLAESPVEWRVLIRFLSQTGLRTSEMRALRWSDIDLESRRVRVRRRFYKGVEDAPKSRYAVRDVPISKTFADEMRGYRRRSDYPADGDLVFCTKLGTTLDSQNFLNRVVRPAAIRAGVPWAGVHTLRHTCASMLFRSGWNAKHVQMLLGHHSPAFTLSTYVHLMPDDLPEPVFREDLVSDQAAERRSARGRLRLVP